MDCSSTSLTMLAKFGFYLNYHFSTVLHWERNCKSDKARITTSVLPGKSRGLITRIAMMVKLTKGRTSKTTLRILLLLLCSNMFCKVGGVWYPSNKSVTSFDTTDLISKVTIHFWYIMLLFPSVFPSYLVVLTWSSIFILLGGHCAGH